MSQEHLYYITKYVKQNTLVNIRSVTPTYVLEHFDQSIKTAF